MSEEKKEHKVRKGIFGSLSLVLVITIIASFLYSLVQLIIEPSNVFVVEERRNI